MDVTFRTDEGRFNYRVCAVVVDEGRLLVMRDWHSPYFYLPGGKVQLHETAEEAVYRELREEMHLDALVIRPLWLGEAFFTEDVSGERFHELCLYFLVELPSILHGEDGAPKEFATTEHGHRNNFVWLPFEELQNEYLYPEFIKTAVLDLPEHLQIVTSLE